MQTDYTIAMEDLRTILKNKQTNIKDLAEKVNLTKQTMGAYLSGKRIMPLDLYFRILNLFHYELTLTEVSTNE